MLFTPFHKRSWSVLKCVVIHSTSGSRIWYVRFQSSLWPNEGLAAYQQFRLGAINVRLYWTPFVTKTIIPEICKAVREIIILNWVSWHKLFSFSFDFRELLGLARQGSFRHIAESLQSIRIRWKFWHLFFSSGGLLIATTLSERMVFIKVIFSTLT